jgi:hypothetical protein
MTRKAPVDKNTWLDFVRAGMCGLCGNSGFINMSGLRTAVGLEVPPVVQAPCICPNGRAIKHAALRVALEEKP